MFNSLIEVEGGVEVRIFVAAPIDDIKDALNDIKSELLLTGETDQEKLDSVIQATKNWWFFHVLTAKKKQIEQAAQAAADNLKKQLTDQLDNSPLRGA